MEDQVKIVTAAFRVAVLASSPALFTAMAVGIVVGLLQSVLQVQDQSIGYVAKLAAVCAVLLMAAGWLMRQIGTVFDLILDAIPLVGAS